MSRSHRADQPSIALAVLVVATLTALITIAVLLLERST